LTVVVVADVAVVVGEVAPPLQAAARINMGSRYMDVRRVFTDRLSFDEDK
jgi:hypothetical protein